MSRKRSAKVFVFVGRKAITSSGGLELKCLALKVVDRLYGKTKVG